MGKNICEKCKFKKGFVKTHFALGFERCLHEETLGILARKKEEVERLKEENKRLSFNMQALERGLMRQKERADNVAKEFAERVKDAFDHNAVDYVAYVIVDDIAKEMVGGGG